MLFFETLIQDVRYASRMLVRDWGFTLVTILALALGIGINTAAFTGYKAMVRRPLDATDPGSMVNLALIRQSGSVDPKFSYPDYEAFRDRLHSFCGLIAQSTNRIMALSGAGVSYVGAQNPSGGGGGTLMRGLGLIPPSPSNGELAFVFTVSENYFSVLGVKPVRGRTFEAMTYQELATTPPALISENFWQSRFGGDPAILGKTIQLEGAAFTIIGVTPRDFVGASMSVPNFWLPLSLEPAFLHTGRSREDQCCRLFGRLAPGVSITQAQAETDSLANQLRTLHDPHSEAFKPVVAEIWPGSPLPIPLKYIRGLPYVILLIMGAVGMVLVIACANVASLQLARSASRQNELSMRAALGAGRMRLIRQLLTESALLAVASGAVALAASWFFLDHGATWLRTLVPPEYGTMILHVSPDPQVFAYVLAISLGASLLFGLAPALESSSAAVAQAIRASTGAAPIRSRLLRHALIATQVAVCMGLLIAGGMLIRSSIRILQMDMGYDLAHLVNLDLQFPVALNYSSGRKTTIISDLRSRLAAIPGVAAVTSAPPPVDGGYRAAATVDKARATLAVTIVEPNYFETTGIQLTLGRTFQMQTGPPESSVIVSESAARRLWPRQNPIGRTVRMSKANGNPADAQPYQVVGVASDVASTGIGGGGDTEPSQVYAPMSRDAVATYPILIRTRMSPSQLIGMIGPVIASVDSNIVVTAYPLEEMLRSRPRFAANWAAALIASVIGVFGLILASMGIYGTVSYVAILRTREVGIRMALGASKRDVLALMLRDSMRPVLVGLAFGLTLGAAASNLLHGILYGVGAVDTIVSVSVSVLFSAIAVLATSVPSWRAMRIDPMAALRYE